jgi:hypothetical protein
MTTKTNPAGHRDLAALLALLLGLVVVYHLALALHGQGRYRDQHLGTALHYAATPIDLKHTVIVGFTATDTPTILELPVWQMVAGTVFKLLGTHWWGCANVVSLVLFLPCLYPLFHGARHFYGDRAAWWTLIFFLAQALVFLYAGEAGTDGFSLAATLWFWFACVRLLEDPVKWFLPAAALGALVAVSKLPFFMAAGLGVFFLVLTQPGRKGRPLAALAGVGLLAGVLFLLWTHYTDAQQAGAEFKFVNLQVAKNNPDMMFWYFGDWHYRLNPANWVKAAWRFANVTFGSFTLIALFGFAVAARRTHPAAKFFFLGSLLTTLVFSHLILHHYNYLMLYSPAVAMLCAASLTAVEEFLAAHQVNRRLLLLTVTGIILAALFQGLMMMRAFSFDHFPETVATVIRAQTTPADKLAVINGGWGGDELTRTDRRGLSLWNAKVFEDPTNYARLKALGFTKLVILSESPYQNAIQIVNPGQTDIPRILAKSYMTPLVEKWPTVYATEDIIIKEIP